MLVQKLWKGGGTETHILSLASSLKRRGHQVAVLTGGGPWVSVFRAEGIPVYVTPAFPGVSSTSSSVLHHLIRMGGYHVVHVHDSPSFHLVYTTLRRYNLGTVHVVMTVHGPYVTRRSIRLLAPHARAVIAVSPQIKRYVLSLGVEPTRVRLVPNGIDIQVFRPRSGLALRQKLHIPAQAFVVGYAGRFSFDKTLLSRHISRILCQYAKNHNGVYALIAGRNAKMYVAAGPSCQVLGHVQDMSSFYNACNVVVGTARVALEALATATPTIAVGHAKYLGIVGRKNLRQAYETNFGDHGMMERQWSSNRLVKDLNQLRITSASSRSEAREISNLVRSRFALHGITARIEALY